MAGEIKLRDGSNGEIHYDPDLLRQHGVTPEGLTDTIQRSLRFHREIWAAKAAPITNFI